MCVLLLSKDIPTVVLYWFFPFIFTKPSHTRFEEMKDQLRKRMFRKRKVRRINFIIANGISIELNTYALVRPTNPGLLFGSVVSLHSLNVRHLLCLLLSFRGCHLARFSH